MHTIVIEKEKRCLSAYDAEGRRLLLCRVALGKNPVGHKQCEGDGKTPEGAYFVCLKRENGKYGYSLGLSYPSLTDAKNAVSEGRLNADLLHLFEAAERETKRPPWGTALGGEIYIHGGGCDSDWTAGCIALSDEDAWRLFALIDHGDRVTIIP